MYVPKRTEEDFQRQARIRQQYEERQLAADEQFADRKQFENQETPEFLTSKDSAELLDEASDNYTQKAIQLVKRLITAQNLEVLDREALVAVAGLQRERFIGCLSLPFSLFFFIVFAASTFLHEDITNVFFIESGLRNAFNNGISQVSGINQFWDWAITSTLIPTVFSNVNGYGDYEPNKRLWNRVLMYNQLTGPLTFEQTRSERTLCFDGDTIFGDMMCYPKDTESSKAYSPKTAASSVTVPDYSAGEYQNNMTFTLQQRLSFWQSAFSPTQASGRRLRTMRTEYMGKLPGQGDPDHKFMASFYPRTWKNVTTSHMTYLRRGGWIDEQTKQIKVKAMLLNAEVGRPRLAQVQILFRFSRAGGVFTRLTVDSMFLKLHDGNASLFADFIFLVMLSLVTCFEVKSARDAFRKKKLKAHLAKTWTILELLIVFFGWLILLGYVYQNSLRSKVKDDLNDVIKEDIADIPPEVQAGSGVSAGEKLQTSADKMVAFTMYFQLLQAEYHLILMFRFFTAFSAQPKLGVVTSTLSASIEDIIHFLIVLLPTFMAYAISGVFLFGRRMQEFATFDSAIGVCFKMAMEGEYDAEALFAEHWWTAALWTWTFMILIVLLMISMVLAIVMDVYTARRKATGQSETVVTTLYNLFTRAKYSRVWVSNKDLLTKGAEMERLIHRDELLKVFPGMCSDQLVALMAAVKYQAELESAAGMDITDSMKMTMAVKLSIDNVNKDLKALQDGAFTGVDTSTGDEWLRSLAEQMAANSHWMLGIQWKLQQLHWQWGAMTAMYGQDVNFEPGSPQNENEDVVL